MSNLSYDSCNATQISRRQALTTGLAGITLTALSPALRSEQQQKSAGQLSQSDLPQVSLRWRTDAELIENFAIALPDTPWRRAWNDAYRRYSDREDQYLEEYREFLAQHDRELITADSRFDEDARDRLSAEFDSRFAKNHPVDPRDEEALESGGERIVDGGPLIKALGMSWWMMDCKTYCFSILRRGANTPSEARIDGIQIQSEEIRQILSMGYYPVRQPEDFDVVVYGDIEAKGDERLFRPGHFGMYKDGKVVSKDILSLHVYKHVVEESAAYASHVMYFRHASHPDPRKFPLPKDAGPVHFEDRDGVATPVVDPYRDVKDVAVQIATGLSGAWMAIVLADRIMRVIFPASLNSSPVTVPHHDKQPD